LGQSPEAAPARQQEKRASADEAASVASHQKQRDAVSTWKDLE